MALNQRAHAAFGMYRMWKVGNKVVVAGPNGVEMDVTESDADYRLGEPVIAAARKLLAMPEPGPLDMTKRFDAAPSLSTSIARSMNFSAGEMFGWQETPASMTVPGNRVKIVTNPHDSKAENVVGTVTKYAKGAGFMGVDLVYIKYTSPADGKSYTYPFGTSHLEEA